MSFPASALLIDKVLKEFQADGNDCDIDQAMQHPNTGKMVVAPCDMIQGQAAEEKAAQGEQQDRRRKPVLEN